MTPYEVIRKAIPVADDSECEHVLYGRTPFPFAEVTPRSLFAAARRWQRAKTSRRILCDHCDHLAEPGSYACAACWRAMHPAAPPAMDPGHEGQQAGT